MPRLSKKQQRIKAAQELQSNRLLAEIFDQLDQEIYERWKSSADPHAREQCYYEARALDTLRDTIDATATE